MGHVVLEKVSDEIDATKSKGGIEILTDGRGGLDIYICNWDSLLSLKEIRDSIGTHLTIDMWYIYGVLHLVEETEFMDKRGTHHISTLFRKDIDVGEFYPCVLGE